MQNTITTPFTKLFDCRYPLIAGPMFLVSDPPLVAEVSEAGGIGAMPSLNWRTSEQFQKAIHEVKKLTKQPFAINLIVNQANFRCAKDLEVCVQEKVPLVITSLGSPKETIKRMHAIGSKVFCDVTTLEYAKKVESLGADGVIAVSSGAGGHAGPISPLVFIPYLKRHIKIPIVAAGGIATGTQLFAALALGASAVQIGTRFIASNEAKVDELYKKAILNSKPEDIILTKKISGTPLSVIKTPYVEKIGTELSWIEQKLLKNPKTKKYVKIMRNWIGSEKLKKAILGPTYTAVWSAGQGVGLIDEILPIKEIISKIINEYFENANKFKQS
ncbi:MAG: nitronate monooxygenase [Deltaproteobacteria bacterium]|nr:nitronate monooxygenase [Deltaproteobacteria bacterium]